LLLLVTAAPMTRAGRHRIADDRQWRRSSVSSAVQATNASCLLLRTAPAFAH
jgi:hypothetical protein